MKIDMTKFDRMSPKPLDPKLSGYKIAYVRSLINNSSNLYNLPVQEPTIEICLIPEDSSVSTIKNRTDDIFAIPPGSITIKFRAGDLWPALPVYVKPKEELEYKGEYIDIE